MFALDPRGRFCDQPCSCAELGSSDVHEANASGEDISWHKPGKKSPADGIVVPNCGRELPTTTAVSDAPPCTFPACFFSQAQLLSLTSKHCRGGLLCMLAAGAVQQAWLTTSSCCSEASCPATRAVPRLAPGAPAGFWGHARQQLRHCWPGSSFRPGPSYFCDPGRARLVLLHHQEPVEGVTPSHHSLFAQVDIAILASTAVARARKLFTPRAVCGRHLQLALRRGMPM